ncbi:Fc.00g014520.m01.CDS01 [Cosmosporella sp. VM-42]
MDLPNKKPPKRKDNRIILQFDYDCFYAQVFENKNPALKSLPVGVKQKNCLATCNYNARSRGLRKLMTVTEAKRTCADLVLVDGEDLTPFRDVSKVLFNFLKSHSWNHKVERLGFDEIFMDVTDIVDYNMFCLNRASMADSFFHLSRTDPEQGFSCDLTAIAGCVEGAASPDLDVESPAYLRLLLGSHLARYLRLKIEEDFGYTSTCGVSPNKLLSKLVGARNKPRNQTTLLALNDDGVTGFMDSHTLRKIPGIGFKTAHLLESHITSREIKADSHSFESTVTAREVRLHSDISSASLEKLLVGPGAERGIGSKIWGLLHGVDPTEVKEASDVPTQLSIEDTYKGLDSLARITEELHKLSYSLVRRMRVDLMVPDEAAGEAGAQRWMARPRTLRLTIRSWPQSGTNQTESQSLNYNSRISRSGPLPAFIFDLVDDMDHIAERLVAEALLPLLRRLQTEKGHRWNLQLINVCVANMVAGAADDRTGAGRDISVMFKRQDEVLRPWRIAPDVESEEICIQEDFDDTISEDSDAHDDCSWGAAGNVPCPKCGHSIPPFAMSAHSRYHELGD